MYKRQRQEMIADAQSATRRITALVADLLDVGAAEDGLLVLEREPTDLVELARAVLAEVVPGTAARATLVLSLIHISESTTPY